MAHMQLLAEELSAFASRDLNLLRRVAAHALPGVDVRHSERPLDLLAGCVVRRQHRFKPDGDNPALFSFARISALAWAPRHNGHGYYLQIWLEDDPHPTCISYISNTLGGEDGQVVSSFPGAEMLKALRGRDDLGAALCAEVAGIHRCALPPRAFTLP